MDRYYDARLLKEARSPVDELVREAYDEHRAAVLNARDGNRNAIWTELYDVTPRLVDERSEEGLRHVKKIRDGKDGSGYLFMVAKHAAHWYTAPHFDYAGFPLMRNRTKVLHRVRRLAEKLAPEYTIEYDAACLSLLYFFALLANPDLNWIAVDYLANGNRYHQYGTRLKGEVKSFVRKAYV